MINVIFELIGLDPAAVHLDDNVVFVVSSLLVIYCICYMFNFFQVLMERLTVKKGR